MDAAERHAMLTALIQQVDSARACLDPIEARAAELGEPVTAVSRHAQRQAELRAKQRRRPLPPIPEEH